MQPFNKYYPPDWTPEKGSVNKFVGKHPLGDRARKIDKGILIVRFELPFNIWCEGCDNHIGMGKDTKYEVVSGARQKVEEWEPEDSEVIRLKDEATMEKMANDAFFKLEHGVQDQRKATETVPVLTQLQRLNDAQWRDPYTQSQQLRRKFRDQKKIDKANQEKKDKLRDKMSLHIDLVDEHPDDDIRAKLTEFADPVIASAEKRKIEAEVSPLFSKRRRGINASAKDDLASRLVTQTRKKVDPFLQISTSFAQASKQDDFGDIVVLKQSKAKQVPGSSSTAASLVSVDYTDSDNSD
ncbi:CWC16 protein [Umbelopsis sp. PMI_123]|nr:CWC16 protein [Umbelopsis sp. PMI_123]